MKYAFETDGQLYVLKDDSGPDNHYRLLAHPTQVPFMARLACEEPDANIEVISTSIVDAAAVAASGGDSLDFFKALKVEQGLMRVTEAMRNVSDHPPERGGWRLLGIPESASLQFSYAVYIGNPVSLEFAGRYHPVFLNGGGFAVANQFNMSFINVMANVYDILRFNSSERVDQNRELFFKFCGLEDSSVFKDLVDQPDLQDERNHRARCVVDAWGWNLTQCPAFLTRCITEPEDKEEPAYVRVFKATRVFADFIRHIWLSSITDTKFVPEAFFQRKEDVTSFKKYIKKFGKGIDNHLKA